MKNLLHCHTKNVHSFPISLENGFYRRVFYAESNHEMWKPFEVAVHPHHVDIKITVLEGELYNPLFEVNEKGELFRKFKWNSHILNGSGGFEFCGEDKLVRLSNKIYKEGESAIMKACELHTIQIKKGKMCAWLVEESVPTCEYFPINYSIKNLATWKPDGLYIEVDDKVKDGYIKKFYSSIL